MGGVYSVTVLNSMGCTATATVNIVVVIPTVLLNPQTSCNGQTVTLTPSGLSNVSTFSWNTGATSSTITVNISATTNYTLTVSSTQGCTAVATTSVTVFANPSAAITGTNTICDGLSTTLTASGGNNYIWNNGTTTNTITVSPSATTSYTVAVYQTNTTATNVVTGLSNFNANNFAFINSTNGYGLPASLFNAIDDLNVETFHATRTTAGQDWGIKYSLNGSHLITALSIEGRNDCCTDRGKGGVMQVWRNNVMVYQSNPLVDAGNGIISASPAPNVIGDEVRYVFLGGINAINGESTLNFTEWIIGGTKLCTTTTQTTVTINARPLAPTITGNSICGTGNVTISASGCSGGTISWFSSQTGGTSLANGASFTANALAISTVYFASCTDANTCVSTTRNYGVAIINPIPTAELTAVPSLCFGNVSQNNGQLMLNKYRDTDQVSWNTGSSYIAPPTATAFAGLPVGGVFKKNLPNTATNYTVRVKNTTTTCYIDITKPMLVTNCACPAGYCEPATITKTR